VLRPAQAFRFLGAERCRNRAIRPRQPPHRRLIERLPPRRRRREDAGRALDHDVARIRSSWRYECDVPGDAARNAFVDPFRAGTGLTKEPPGQYEPSRPLAGRRQLRRPCPPRAPRILKIKRLRWAQPMEDPRLLRRLQSRQQFHR